MVGMMENTMRRYVLLVSFLWAIVYVTEVTA